MIKTLLLLIVSICTIPMLAQSDGLCDGDRLIEPIFNEIEIIESVAFDVGVNTFNAEVDLVMDIYQPVGDDLDRRPVVVMAHGGSFVAGSRTNPVMVATCTELARRGYVAASIEYSLFSVLALGFPDSTDLVNTIVKGMGEMKSAVRFFREDGLGENIYGVDPDLISVGGYSAGAILANHQGMLDDGDDIDDFLRTAIDDQGGFENLGNRLEISDDILSVFNISGSVYRLGFIDQGSAPIYSGQGDMDETVPYMFGLTGGVVNTFGSFNINETYQSVGVESQLFTFVGGGHTDIFEPPFADDLVDMYDGFFEFNKDIVCTALLSSSKDLPTTSASIFPNPSKGELNFQFSDDLNSEYNIEVFNQLGQLIHSSQQFNDTTAQIYLDNMDQGLYLVKVNFAENYQPITKRVVISNN